MTEVLDPRPDRGEGTSSYLGEDVIELFGKPSTRTRLHEIGHKVLGHEPGRMTLSQFVDRELDAEEYAYKCMDKKPTHRIGAPIVYELVEDWGLDPRESVRVVTNRLAARGIKVGKRARRDLNWFAHGLERE